MSKILIVAIRDFKVTVLRKAFLIAIIAIPLGIAAIMALFLLILATKEQPPLRGTIAIIDQSGEVLPAASIEFQAEQIKADAVKEQEDAIEQMQEQMSKSGGFAPQAGATMDMGFGVGVVEIELEGHDTAEEEAALKERVTSGELLAVAVIPPDVLDTPDPDVPRNQHPTFSLFVDDSVDSDHIAFMESRIGEAIVRVRAARADLDADQAIAMLRRPRSDTRKMLETGGEQAEDDVQRMLRMMVPMAFMLLLFVGTFTAGQQLMMSTIEEKSNRVMEVLLSAVSSMQLMTGKIIGQVGVGLLLVLVYGSVSLVGLGVFKQMHVIDTMDIVYFVVYFFLAFFMVASLMAAVGAAVSDIREANTLFTPVMLIIMIPWVLWMPISQSPNGIMAVIFSFLPPASPFVMMLRLTADETVPVWQIPASMLWGAVCVVVMVWGCAKIFRVGVLMQGKPPSPVELLKWMRYR